MDKYYSIAPKGLVMFSIGFTRATISAVVFLMLAGGPAIAKKVKVVPGDPPITVDIPATWEISESKRGIQANTSDEEVYIWFENYKPSQIGKIMEEHNKYFDEQGVIITGNANQEARKFSTYSIKKSVYPATYEGTPTVLRYLSVVPRSEEKRHLLICYWASPDADKDYADEMEKMMKSLGASIDEQVRGGFDRIGSAVGLASR